MSPVAQPTPDFASAAMRSVRIERVDFPNEVRTFTLSCGCQLKASNQDNVPGDVGKQVHFHVCGPRTSGYQIRASANRGREYAVSFSRENDAQVVKVKCYGPSGNYWRLIWNTSYPSMTTTVACAIRAAVAKRDGAQS